MTQFMLLNDLRFFCRKAASFNRPIALKMPGRLVDERYGDFANNRHER